MTILLKIIAFCILSFIGSVSCEGEPSARILLYKSTETNPVVEQKDFVIIYQIINTGEVTANNIEIADKYDPKSFESIENVNEEGNVLLKAEELISGGQLTFNVTVKPKLYGMYESTRARIKYGSGLVEMDDVEPDYKNGHSTSLGRIKIISIAENLRKTSYYLGEWLIFFSVLSFTIVVPFCLWYLAKDASGKISIKRKAI